MHLEPIALVRLAAAAALLQTPISAASAAPTAAPPAASTADTPAAPSAAPAEGPLSQEEIREAVAKVAGDSNLAGRQKSRQLRWRQSQAPPANTPSWTGGFFGFLAQSMSVLFWLAGAAVAVSAAIGLIRWLRALPPAIEPSPAARARSVGGLDIDPDSLPEDIGAAALALLEAQRMREALSLLYRGALSRAVHRYGVMIGESYTESEALRAVNANLDPDRAAYVTDLVGVRQRTVYAGETAARETLERLCHGFAPSLDGAAP